VSAKQYQRLAGRPVLRHCLETLVRHPRVDGVRAVIHPADRALYDEAAAGLALLPPAEGGASRQDSVRNGLESLAGAPPALVLIHDGVRALLTPALIDRVIDGLQDHVAVLPALPVTDTLKRVADGRVDGTVERAGLARAEQSLGLRPRIGTGFDVHRLGPGDGMVLLGVWVAGPWRLIGHSDADVGLHALTDALLATCGAGDIGDHFPPSDPQWKGQASSLFLEHAARLVREAGGTILNADVSLVAEAPKIAPHRQAMRATLARLLGIAIERCSVKATTNETMGFVGRGEGIAAIATASVFYAPKGDAE